MNNAVMLVKDRFALTQQALATFFENSRLDWTLTIVDDGSKFATQQLLTVVSVRPNVTIVRAPKEVCCTARMRNLGVYWSEKMFGRGVSLYLSDNDAYFTPGWDEALSIAYWKADSEGYKLIGPYRHPYHLPSKNNVVRLPSNYEVVSTDAVQGIGHQMRWETWDKYGPLDDQGAIGTNMSEDWAFCQRIVKDGFLVGSIQPEVVHNCGIHGTNGKPSPGAEVMERIPGVLML